MAQMRFLEKLMVNGRVYGFLYRHTWLKWFLDFCGRLEGDALEIGCGNGTTTAEIRRRFGVNLTAIDSDPAQAELAKRNLAGRGVKILQADAAALPFGDSAFDCLVEADTFHHIGDYRKALKEAGRVLKKGGSFFMMDIGKWFLWPLMAVLPFDPFEAKFTKDEMMAEMEKAGFGIAKHRGKDVFMIHAVKAREVVSDGA